MITRDRCLKPEVTIQVVQDRCIHDLLEDQCGHCKSAPYGIQEMVFTTKGGQVFHNWEDCAFLKEGQDLAEAKGHNTHQILQRKWSEVFSSLGACEWCCALHHLKGVEMRKCQAFIEGSWRNVSIVKERFTGFKQREFQVYESESNYIYFLSQKEIRL